MTDSGAITVRGTLDGAGAASPIVIQPNGRPVVGVEISGTFVQTLIIEETLNGDNWVTAAQVLTAGDVAASATQTAAARLFVKTAGRSGIRVRQSAFTSGTATIVLDATEGAVGASAGGGGGGASTIADGADTAEGATTDAKVTGDNAGTVSAKLRGLLYEFGDQADAAATTDAGTFSFLAFTKRLLSRLTTLLPQNAGRLNVDGAGGTFPVTNTNLDAALSTLLPTSDFDTKTGALTETAPATDTASSGLNGRAQRIAQRITSLIALLPAALVGGRLDVNLGAAPATVTAQGGLTHNNAAPGATNLGVLAGVANAAAPTFTEADQVLHSLNLHGDTRVIAAGHTPAAPVCTFTRGANTTAYTIGDEVGTAGTAPTTISVARYNGGSGVIQGATVIYSSYAATIPQLVLLLFSATVTLAGDNAQLNLSDADAAKLIGMIPLTSTQSGQYSAGAPVAAGNTVFVGAPTAPIHYIAGGSEQTIYACLITLNAFTPIANSETLSVTLSVENN